MNIETIAEKLFAILPTLLPHLFTYLEKRKAPQPQPSDEIEQLASLLTGRLLFLLRYMDASQDARYPHSYGRILSAYVDVGDTKPNASYSPRAEEGWAKASQFACWYLSALGLVKQYGAIGGEVAISDLGKTVIRSDRVRQNFKSAFEQQLPY